MQFNEVMKTLKEMGTVQNRKEYESHGAGNNLFGVSYANLKKLFTKIQTNQKLADMLWAEGNTDAMILATMIADPKAFDIDKINIWIKDIRYHLLIDEFVSNIICYSKYEEELIDEWIESNDEYISRAGWNILINLAIHNYEKPDGYFVKYITLIEENMHKSKNRTREAMNNALISIGIRNDSLKRLAIEAAKTINKNDTAYEKTLLKPADSINFTVKSYENNI